VEKWMRDVRALALLHGSREISETRAAAALVDAPLTYDLLPLGHIQPVWS
jgi:alkylation response protein AidB-like acyl-CoA dehydrogenase